MIQIWYMNGLYLLYLLILYLRYSPTLTLRPLANYIISYLWRFLTFWPTLVTFYVSFLHQAVQWSTTLVFAGTKMNISRKKVGNHCLRACRVPFPLEQAICHRTTHYLIAQTSIDATDCRQLLTVVVAKKSYLKCNLTQVFRHAHRWLMGKLWAQQFRRRFFRSSYQIVCLSCDRSPLSVG